MHRTIRFLVLIAGAAVIAAATHANVEHAGGYHAADAPMIIALAVLLTVGMSFCGYLWGGNQRFGSVLLGLCILSGEAYWVLTNTEREIATREERDAPALRAFEARADAEKRVTKAEENLKDASDAVTNEAAKKDCLKNCAAMLTGAVTTARTALDDARRVLSNTPRPLSPAPLPARLSIAPWLWDLIMAGLRSLAVVGGSIAIGLAAHPKRERQGDERVVSPEATFAEVSSAQPRRLTLSARSKSKTTDFAPRVNKREHVARFLRDTNFRHEPNGQASLRALHALYNDWCSGDRLSPKELGAELRAIVDALDLKCEQAGSDVIVRGAALGDHGATATSSQGGRLRH